MKQHSPINYFWSLAPPPYRSDNDPDMHGQNRYPYCLSVYNQRHAQILLWEIFSPL